VLQLWAGLPDGIFAFAQNPNFGTFLKALEWNILVYFRASCYSYLRPFDVFFGLWYILWSFG
jgi:hypothetical protein